MFVVLATNFIRKSFLWLRIESRKKNESIWMNSSSQKKMQEKKKNVNCHMLLHVDVMRNRIAVNYHYYVTRIH